MAPPPGQCVQLRGYGRDVNILFTVLSKFDSRYRMQYMRHYLETLPLLPWYLVKNQLTFLLGRGSRSDHPAVGPSP